MSVSLVAMDPRAVCVRAAERLTGSRFGLLTHSCRHSVLSARAIFRMPPGFTTGDRKLSFILKDQLSPQKSVQGHSIGKKMMAKALYF